MHLVSISSLRSRTMVLIKPRTMLCYVVMSYLALCVNIYQNPEDPKAPLDLKLMKIVTNFLSLLRGDDTDPTAHHLIIVCNEFERLARRAVANARERRATEPSPPATVDHTMPSPTRGVIPIVGFTPESETSIPDRGPEANNAPQESTHYAAFGAPDSGVHGHGSLLFGSETTDASQYIGTGSEEIHFANSDMLPEDTGIPASSDFWQLPMPWEWNWADMGAN
jgi:hypothetical protein